MHVMIQVFDLRKDSIKDCDTKHCEVIFKDVTGILFIVGIVYIILNDMFLLYTE